MELYLIFVDFFGVRCDLEEDGLESNQFIVQFVVLMSRLQDNIPISNEMLMIISAEMIKRLTLAWENCRSRVVSFEVINLSI